MPRALKNKCAYQLCPILERTRPPETVSSTLGASLSLSSLTLQTLSCCFHPWHHAQRHHSSDWLSLQPVSLCIVDGRTPSTTWRFHWFEIWLLTSFPYMLEIQISGTSAENQHVLPLCFSVLLPIVWLFFFFFNDFVTFFVYFCQWSTFIGVLF